MALADSSCSRGTSLSIGAVSRQFVCVLWMCFVDLLQPLRLMLVKACSTVYRTCRFWNALKLCQVRSCNKVVQLHHHCKLSKSGVICIESRNCGQSNVSTPKSPVD